MGFHNDRLIETVLLSTQNTCLNGFVKYVITSVRLRLSGSHNRSVNQFNWGLPSGPIYWPLLYAYLGRANVLERPRVCADSTELSLNTSEIRNYLFSYPIV